jgi:membrane fusion protein, multidrug efflux system
MKTINLKLTVFLMLIALFACQQNKQAELDKLRKQHDEIADKIKKLELELGDSIKQQKSLIVAVTEIQPSIFKHFIEVQGKLDGEGNVDVFPEGTGIIDEVYVKAGQQVAKGQALASIDDAAARQQLKALETQYKLVKETFEKQQRLWEQKIGSELQFLQAKAAKEQLESQLNATREQVGMFTIKSPISGTVEEVNVKVGQVASAALPTPPFRVLNFNSLKVKAEIAEAYARKVNTGDNVIIYFPDLDREIDAKITSASRFISPANRTFTVEARLSTDKIGYKANMIAILKINDYKNEKAISIPVNYIQSDPKNNFVYVAKNDGKKITAQKAPVKQGQSYNGTVEITEGLKAGDKVITSGYLELEEGESIKF